MGSYNSDLQEKTITDAKDKTSEPSMYKILLHNDDFTTKAFVVEILMSVFNKPLEEATQIMWHVHKNGIGVCGVYPYEIAETKVNQVTAAAREYGFPLKTTMEEQ